MWSHHGGNHHGICLEFGTDNDLFKTARSVSYAERYPSWLPHEFERNPQKAIEVILTKSADWQYEHEFRLISTLSKTTAECMVADGDFCSTALGCFEILNSGMQLRCRVGQDHLCDTFASYPKGVRQFLAARKCVSQVFNPADERLAAQLFREHVELKQIEHAVLLACARRYVALLNGTAVGTISGLNYFSLVIQEVQSTQTSEGYWHHLAQHVAQFEGQWVAKQA